MTQDELDKYFETCIARWREIAKDPNNDLPEEYNTPEKLEKKLPEPETLFYLQNWDKECGSIFLKDEGQFIVEHQFIIIKNIYFFESCSYIETGGFIFQDVAIYNKTQQTTIVNLAFAEGNLKLVGYFELEIFMDFKLDLNSLDLTEVTKLTFLDSESGEIILDTYRQNPSKIKINSDQLPELKLEEIKKPNIYTEGESDVKYLKTAIDILNYKKLKDVEIKWIGRKTKGGTGTEQSGCGGLNNYWLVNKANLEKTLHKVVLLYDFDQPKVIEEDVVSNKLFKIQLKANLQNQKYKKGIENLLPENCITDELVNEKNVKKANTLKMKLCDFICSKKDPADFENFKPLLDKLTQILKN